MALTHLNSVCASLILSLIRMFFRMSLFCTPFQFKSSYLIESLQMALRLESESDSTIRSSVLFCLRASSLALSSALELDGFSFPWVFSFSAMFRLLQHTRPLFQPLHFPICCVSLIRLYLVSLDSGLG